VQGKAAGLAAAQRAQKEPHAAVSTLTSAAWRDVQARVEAPLHRKEGAVPGDVKRRLGQIVDNALGAIRQGNTLETALGEVRSIARDDLARLACRQRDATGTGVMHSNARQRRL
jgi:succinate dehydrogenase/fumarate reductase flavoprotein subunit